MNPRQDFTNLIHADSQFLTSGGVDLLLHLLTNIKDLPVTKTLVKQSGMGKAIGSIEKHSICANTPNQGAITDRVQQIKSAWNASVKARKEQVCKQIGLGYFSSFFFSDINLFCTCPQNGKAAAPAKRQIQMPSAETASPPAKKIKLEEKPKGMKALSSLLKKVSGSTPDKNSSSTPTKSPGGAKANDTPSKSALSINPVTACRIKA